MSLKNEKTYVENENRKLEKKQRNIYTQNSIVSIIISSIFIIYVTSKNISSTTNWVISSILGIIFITSTVFFRYKYKKGEINIYLYLAGAAVGSFFMVYFINIFLVSKIRYLIWLIGVLIFCIYSVMLKRDDKNTMKKEILFICVIMLLGTGILYGMNEEPYKGIRMKNEVKQYLTKTKSYKKNDIKSMALVERDGETQYIGITFNDEPDIMYFYGFKNKKITQLQIEGQKIGKHKE